MWEGSFDSDERVQELLDKYSLMVYRLAYAQTGTRHDADDIYQEVFDDRGNSLEITCRRDEAGSIYSFTVNDGGSSEPVSVAGMADGMYIRDENAPFLSSMHLRRKGIPLKEYFELPVPLTYSTMDEEPAVSRTYDAAVYDFRADDLDKDALLSIAQSMK